MEFSEILNIVLGSGLFGTVVTIATLRSTARKAKAEAVKAEADAESVRMDNAEHATRILMENIVKPLKDEFNETKKELADTKKELARNTREMARFRKAVESANSCRYSADCPVLDRLRDLTKERGSERTGTDRGKGQHRERDTACDRGTGTTVGSEPDPGHGQPP